MCYGAPQTQGLQPTRAGQTKNSAAALAPHPQGARAAQGRRRKARQRLFFGAMGRRLKPSQVPGRDGLHTAAQRLRAGVPACEGASSVGMRAPQAASIIAPAGQDRPPRPPRTPSVMNGDILAPWAAADRAAWNQRPLRLQHHLHQQPAFQLDALAALIETYPRPDYALVMTNRQGDSGQRWREGDLAGTPGRQVIDTIASGSLWLNLRQAHLHGTAYAELLARAYAEIATQVPGFSARSLKMGILISSPGAQVHYHCDLPGQLLWQIAGRKRVWVYPPTAPYLQPEWLEDIAYTGFEFSLVYDPAFDRQALIFELEPGQMLSWPLNSPHRVDNEDCLNISVTSEHWTPENRRAQKVHLANAVLRHRLGLKPQGRALAGPAYWAKAALQAAWRRSPLASATQRQRRSVEFRLAPGEPGGCIDIAAGR